MEPLIDMRKWKNKSKIVISIYILVVFLSVCGRFAVPVCHLSFNSAHAEVKCFFLLSNLSTLPTFLLMLL